MRTRCGTCVFLVATLAVLLLAAPSPAQTEDEPLRKLWSEYPLNPASEQDRLPSDRTAKEEAAAAELEREATEGRAEAVGPQTTPTGDFPMLLVLLAAAGALTLALVMVAVGRAPALFAPTTREAPRRTFPRVSGLAPPRRKHAPSRRAPAPRVPAVPPPRHPEPEPDALTEYEVCVVRWWRGYVKSQFYAATLTLRSDGRERVVAWSPEFWWRKEEPPPGEDAALAAYTILVERLEAAGWALHGVVVTSPNAPGLWYETAFSRPLKPSLQSLAERLAREAEL